MQKLVSFSSSSGHKAVRAPTDRPFRLISKTPRWPTSKIFNFHFGSNCFSLQSDLHCNIAAKFSLSVHPAFVKVFMVGLSAMITCESFCCLLALPQFFTLASPLAPPSINLCQDNVQQLDFLLEPPD